MDTFTLNRSLKATVIPAGDQFDLPSGTSVQVVQALGGSVTVRVNGNLFRIGTADVGALEGYTVPVGETKDAAPGGPFSETAVWEALKTCFDPEIPINIVDLGLIYDLSVEKAASGKHDVEVKMTLTAQGCGMGPVIAEDARQKIASLPEVESAKVHVVWDPVWTPQMISPEGRKRLGLE